MVTLARKEGQVRPGKALWVLGRALLAFDYGLTSMEMREGVALERVNLAHERGDLCWLVVATLLHGMPHLLVLQFLDEVLLKRW